eukprot:COSAG02_NODE_6199_length_3735_cov_2.553630_8_plen_98_part_01
MYTACYQNATDAHLVRGTVNFDRFESSWPGAPDSVERCNQLCLSTGVAFKYFGMQAGHACFCGMDYGAFCLSSIHEPMRYWYGVLSSSSLLACTVSTD